MTLIGWGCSQLESLMALVCTLGVVPLGFGAPFSIRADIEAYKVCAAATPPVRP